MKINLKQLFILVFATLLISCENDDNINADITGEWNIESINYTGSTVLSNIGNSITSNFVAESSNENASMTFHDDNTFTSQGSYTIELQTTTLGQTQSQTTTVDDYDSEGEWSLNGNILTVDGELVSVSSNTPVIGEPADTPSQDLTIVELTDTSMTVISVVEDTIEESGSTIEYTVDSTIVFSKQ